MISVLEKPLFSSTDKALSWVYNFQGRIKPMVIVKEEGRRPKNPNAIGGLDGAAQAGMIKSMVSDLGRPSECVLICRYATHSQKCPHCADGVIMVQVVKQAIVDLVPFVRASALVGTSARDHATATYILQYFRPEKQKKTLVDLAEKLGFEERAVKAHIQKSFHALHTLENDAWRRIEASLRVAGIVV